MTGKFTGKTSMGFITGEIYDLRSEINTILRNSIPVNCICLYDKNSKAWCPYASLETVLQNWDFNIVQR